VLREPSNSKDKWITFMAMFLESWQNQNYFAYTVELKLRDGEVYGSVSFEIPTPEVKYTKENGVIAYRHKRITRPLSHSRVIKNWRISKLSNYQSTPPFRTFPKQQRPPRVDISPQDSGFSHSEKQSYSHREPKETQKRNAWRWESYTKKKTSQLERQKVLAKA
jgi:hypothetical protein